MAPRTTTRQSIVTAFIKLLATTPYSKITLVDVAKEANVSRSTLYRNFATKDDILPAVLSQITEEWVQTPAFKASGFNDFHTRAAHYHDYVAMLFEHLLDYRNLLVAIYESGADRLLEDEIAGAFSNEGLTDTEWVAQSFMIGGICRVVRIWVRNDFKATPAQIADAIEEPLRIKAAAFAHDPTAAIKPPDEAAECGESLREGYREQLLR